MRAAVPTEELKEAVGIVEGIDVVVWDAEGDPPEDLEVWVPHYGATARLLRRVEDLPALSVVQIQSAGYEGLPELLPPGVVLCNAAGVHDDATAEHALGLTLAVLRGIPESVGARTWQDLSGRQSLADARVLVLGYGSIGRAVATRMLACRAQVTAVASRPREDDLVGRVHGADELLDLLPEQDVVVVLLPMSEANRHAVGTDQLAALPDGSVVVNVARGGVLDTAAVLAETGRLRFALDVTDPEPLPDGHPLWSAPDVLVTPHVAGGTTAMLPRMAALVRDQLRRYVAGESLANVVAGP
jgi:phosphoglycerate dehydrogenase-like enzyme